MPNNIRELLALEWNEIKKEYLGVRIEASQILEKHHDTGSAWCTYIGINPGLMPDITRWYNRSEESKRKILQLHERGKQILFEVELYQRQAIRQASVPYISSAHESPYRSTVNENWTQSFNAEANLAGGLSVTSGARTRRIYPNGGVDSHIE
ncbi:hypothetical protein PQX77_004877 [Marasmius sp. AFHP31]|nr:hypothetical protein PQX77_004877 [Marasmius sp. AFHP31]